MTRTRRTAIVIAATLASLSTGLVGIGHAAPASRSFKSFQSPSKNIGCEMTKSFVRCDIKSRDWKPPATPKSCMLDYGQGLAVSKHGKGDFVCAGDTALNPTAHKLAYGDSIHVGRMHCTSKASGMVCKNHQDGHGFSISKESYRRF